MSFYACLIQHKPEGKSDAWFAENALGISKQLLHDWKRQHEAGYHDFIPHKPLITKCAQNLSKYLGEHIDPRDLAFGKCDDCSSKSS